MRKRLNVIKTIIEMRFVSRVIKTIIEIVLIIAAIVAIVKVNDYVEDNKQSNNEEQVVEKELTFDEKLSDLDCKIRNTNDPDERLYYIQQKELLLFEEAQKRNKDY